MNNIKPNELLAFVIGVILGGTLTYVFFSNQHSHSHDGTHQITQPDEEYHVHADFLIYINDDKINLSEEVYMTTATQELHEHAHLHDGNGEVQHMHSEGITFAEFINSLGLTVTDDCISYNEETYCDNDTKQLQLFVNNELYDGPITGFEAKDEDRLLLYYGPYDEEKITTYMNEVKNDACYYSGTCPERGIAPPESCGLTCEL